MDDHSPDRRPGPEVSPGWAEVLAAVRRREHGELRTAPERQPVLELAMSVGLTDLPHAVGCSVSRQEPDGRFVTPVAAGPVAQFLDDAQYAHDDGPCLRAARSGQPEWLDPLAADERWPEFVHRAPRPGSAARCRCRWAGPGCRPP
jgi:hypothetical protein